MERKEYDPCEICGFDLYTEKHHTSGKIWMNTIYVDGDLVMEFKQDLDVEQKLRDAFKHKMISIRDEHRHIDNEIITLCANCHNMFHKRKMSYRQIYDMYFYRKIPEKMDNKLRDKFSDKLKLLDMENYKEEPEPMTIWFNRNI